MAWPGSSINQNCSPISGQQNVFEFGTESLDHDLDPEDASLMEDDDLPIEYSMQKLSELDPRFVCSNQQVKFSQNCLPNGISTLFNSR